MYTIDQVVRKLDILPSIGIETRTPFSTAREVVSDLNDIDWKDPDQMFLDPACGVGTLLFAVIEKLLENGHDIDYIISDMICGADIDPVQCMLVESAFKMLSNVTPTILCEDSLDENWEWDMKTKKLKVVMNAPFNDDQTKKNNKDNYRSASKNITLQFYDKMLELDDRFNFDQFSITGISPVRGWWAGKNKSKNFEKYVEKGLYKVQNKGKPFKNNHTGEIGVFHFNKDESFKYDEFVQSTPLERSILDEYEMAICVGKWTTEPIKAKAKKSGKYKIVVTSGNILYTNSNNLFKDKSRGSWRVGINHNGNKEGNSLYGGPLHVIEPDTYLSYSMSCFIVKNKAEAIKLKEYLESDEVLSIMAEIKVSNTNTKYHFSFVPPMNKSNVK